MSNTVDVKSIYAKHLVRHVIDSSHVELYCGRIGTSDGEGQQPPTPPRGPVCDSCITAARFTCDLDGRRWR